VADLLVWGNYTYAELDLQSFIDEAQYSVAAGQSYTDLTGAVQTHNRFICEMALIGAQDWHGDDPGRPAERSMRN
jgi:hypothetical protein